MWVSRQAYPSHIHGPPGAAGLGRRPAGEGAMGPLGDVDAHPLADDPFGLETVRRFVQVSLVTNIGVCPAPSELSF
jgi:hypothetical protein